MNIPLSLPLYFFLGFALIVLGRAIHYLAITRYFRKRGIQAIGRSPIRDWKDWAEYRKARLSNHESLTWWYVLWIIQILVLLFVAGWIANGLGKVQILAPAHLPQPVSDPRYVNVFDITRSGYRQWWFAAFGLIFVAVGLALPVLSRIGMLPKQRAWNHGWFRALFVGFAILWTLGAFVGTYTEYRKGVEAMRTNQARVVEGPVTHFTPMPYGGHKYESFSVNGVEFRYSDYEITAGFNNTTSHGGPIRENLPVKIWYQGGEILRLDIEKTTN